MQKILIILAVALLFLIGLGFWSEYAEAPGVPHDERLPSVEEYVRQNITQLSPEPAVMGGTFYVTAIEAKNGRGTVHYEDGHMALIADFEYVVDKYGVTVTSFEVRE